jgi:hypothetical protein
MKASAAWSRLDKPLSGASCVSAWLIAIGIFVGGIALFGGPTSNDANESIYSTWAVAHGQIACTYPPPTHLLFLPEYQPDASIAPLWPLVSGGLAALTEIGHAVAFPSQQALGSHCSTAYLSMYEWADRTMSLWPTLGLGYVSWLILLAGIVALLRATGRGRTVWEPFTVLFVALVPIVWEPVLSQFHPQDIVAMGLALSGMACVERRTWIWAGVFLGLAVSSQQFALLVLAPLLLVVPRNATWRMLFASAGAWLVVALPFVATSRQAWRAALLGSGDSPSFGGTLLWQLDIHHGPALVFLSRVLPIIVSVLIAWRVHARFGPRALEPVLLVSLVATSLSLRLVFEEGLFGYKFMALSVMLIMLDVVRGRLSGQLLAWLALVTVAYNPFPYGLAFNGTSLGHFVSLVVPYVFLGIVVGLLIRDAVGHRIRPYLAGWLVIGVTVFCISPPRLTPATWLWQIILVGTGVILAVGPLVASTHGADAPHPVEARTP